MPYTWFKVHHDLLSEPRFDRFRPEEKWAWIALLSLASRSKERGYVLLDDDDIAYACDFHDLNAWQIFKDKLKAKGFINLDGLNRIQIVDWDAVQVGKPSDSKEATRKRQQESRKRRKQAASETVPDPVTPCHAQSHAPYIDLDPDLDPDPDLECLPKSTDYGFKPCTVSASPETARTTSEATAIQFPEAVQRITLHPEVDGDLAIYGEEPEAPDPFLSFGGQCSVAFDHLISEERGAGGVFNIEQAIALDQEWQTLKRKKDYKGRQKLNAAEIRAFLEVYNRVNPPKWPDIALYYDNGRPRPEGKARSKAVQHWFNRFGAYSIAVLRFACWRLEKSDFFSNRLLNQPRGSDYAFNLDWLLGKDRDHVTQLLSAYLNHLQGKVQQQAVADTVTQQWEAWIETLPEDSAETTTEDQPYDAHREDIRRTFVGDRQAA